MSPTPSRKRYGRRLQLRAAPGAVRPARLAGALALRARRQYAGAATGTEGVALLRPCAALRAVTGNRLAEDEVEDDADAVGDENRQQRPHHVTHAAAAGVAVDIANHQRPPRQGEWRDDGQQSP